MRDELEVVNRAELARLFDVSLPTVDSWRRRGLPVEQGGGRGRPMRFSLPAAIAWRLEQEAGEDDRDAVVSFEEARTAKMVAEAELARIELQKRRGEVVELDVVAELAEAAFGVVRQRVLGLASKVAAQVATAGSAAKARGILEREAREILDELADGNELAKDAHERGGEESGRAPARRGAASSS